MKKAEKAMLELLAAQLDVLLSMQSPGKGGRSTASAQITAARKLADQHRASSPAHGKKPKKDGKAAKRR